LAWRRRDAKTWTEISELLNTKYGIKYYPNKISEFMKDYKPAEEAPEPAVTPEQPCAKTDAIETAEANLAKLIEVAASVTQKLESMQPALDTVLSMTKWNVKIFMALIFLSGLLVVPIFGLVRSWLGF